MTKLAGQSGLSLPVDSLERSESSAHQNHSTNSSRRLSRCIYGFLILSILCISLSSLFIGHHITSSHRRQQWAQLPPLVPRKGASKLEDTANRYTQRFKLIRNDIIHEGDYVTEILKGKVPFPSNDTHHRLKFRPGTLQMTSAEALRHCYVNRSLYENHLDNNPNPVLMVAVSKDHKLIYRNIAKSSSSSGRHAMKNIFNGVEKRLKKKQLESLIDDHNYTLVSFIREPLNRFYSSYDEAVFRLGPWMGEGPIVNDKPRVRKWYHEVKHRVEAYPYLYEGLQTIEDYRRMYCPAYLLELNKYLKCNEVESIDNGNLTRRFEQFVRDYDGLHPFDIHLHLQTTSLVYSLTAEPTPVSVLYNATEAELGWEEIARQKGVPIPEEGMTHGRKQTRRFNMKLVSAETKRRICQLVALDYCCLNLKLPDECTMGGLDDEADVVFCAAERGDNIENSSSQTHSSSGRSVLVQPWKNPP